MLTMKYEDDYNFDENDFEYAMDLYAESMDKDEEVDDILDDEEETDDEEDVTLQLAKDYKAVNIT